MPKRDFNDHCWKDVVDAETLDIYRSYHRDTFVGAKPALLAIDLYRKAYLGGPKPVAEVNREHDGSCGIHAWNALPHTQRLLAAARRAGVPVIYTTRHAETGGVHSTNRKKRDESESLYAIQPELAPVPGEHVIYKERASAFFGTTLVTHLRKLGAQSLIICGESTSGCVRASTVDAYSYGFHSTLVEECVYDRSILSHKVNLFDLHHKYADVMHIDDVVGHLERLAPERRSA